MIQKTEKKEIRSRIHQRIRRKLQGTAERPRLAVFRSVAHIYAQVIDDAEGRTIVAASSVDKAAAGKPAKGAKTSKKAAGGNVAAAIFLAKNLLGYRDVLSNEHSGPNGGPIPIDLSKLSDEDLEQLQQLADKAHGRGGL